MKSVIEGRERLAALYRYQILDTEPEEEFEGLVRLAADIFEAPMAMISLVDVNRQWFKATLGLGLRETGLDVSICKYALEGSDVLIVEDTMRDGRTCEMGTVIGEPHVRFYAGAPLKTAEGEVLGTICVMDTRPRKAEAEKMRQLELLAQQVMVLLEMRLSGRRMLKTLESLNDGLMALDAEGVVTYCNEITARDFEVEREEVVGASFLELLEQKGRGDVRALIDGVMASGEPGTAEIRWPRIDSGEWLELRLNPTGEGLTLFAARINERKQADRELRLLKKSIDRVDDSVVITEVVEESDEFRVFYVNEAFERQYGVKKRDAVGAQPDGLAAGKVGCRLPEERLRKAIETGEVVKEEEVMRRGEGSTYVSEIKVSPIYEDGRLMSLVTTQRDVTERVHGEEMLKAEARLLTAIGERRSLRETLELADQLLVESVEGSKALILTVDREHYEYREVVAAGIEDALVAALRGKPVGAERLCSMALERREFIASRFRADDEYEASYRAKGYEGVWFLPVFDREGTEAAGVAVFFEKYREIEEWERDLLERLGRIVGIAVEADRQERVIKESERMVEIASRVGKIGGWSVDVATGRSSWSEETRVIFGIREEGKYSVNELVKRYVPEDQERIRACYDRCVRFGEPFDDEYQVVRGEGEVVYVRVIGEAVRDVRGEVVRVEGAMQDITHLKEIEMSLVASEGRFRQLAEAMPFIVWTARVDGELDYASKKYFEYTGRTVEEARRGSYLDMIHPEDREEVAAGWGVSLRQACFFEAEYRLRARGGKYRWHRVQAMPVFDEAGELVKWYGTAIDIDDVKGLERKAAAVAERLETTLESISDGFMILDTSWRITFLNPAAEKLIGRSAQSLMGRSYWEAFPTAKKLSFNEKYQRVMNERVSLSFMERVLSGTATFEIRAFPVPEGMAVYFQDVTNQERTAEAIRQSEERFRILSRATSDAVWDWDLTNDVIWWNEGYERVFGRAPVQEVTSDLGWVRFVHPEDRERVLARIQDSIEGRRDDFWSCEYRYQADGEKYFTVVDRGQVIRNEEGVAVRIVGGMTDITERVEAEEKARQQAALLDRASDAILVRDLDHRITYWNEGATNIYGWSREEAQGKSALEFYREPRDFLDAVNRTLRMGEWSGELEQVTKEGTVISIEARWTLLRDEKGSPRAIFAINSDVSERKRLEQQILRAQRMETVGTLAGGIAHDLNNVLQPILMTVSLLEQEESDPVRLEDLDTIATSARRGADMIRQLLMFSRGSDGPKRLVAPRDVVMEVQKIVRETFPKSIDFEVNLPAKVWPISADPTQMHQLLANLCVNARDSMPDGGKLTVTVEHDVLDGDYARRTLNAKPGPYVILKVEDTGCGMEQEVLDRVFDPFFTTKEVGKGTGLGLSTVHSIARGHRGFVHVYSEVGEGTTFKVYLPADVSAEEMHESFEQQLRIPKGRGEVILVVDDEESIRRVARRTLERFGYQVMTAENGAEAVSIFAREGDGIDLVLTDMAMPVMDGVATMVALRKLDPGVRIIGTSGLNVTERVAKGVEAGMDHFLPKPFTTESLLNTVAAIVRRGEE